jgi:ligand-binding sensor domain-containing protein
MKSSGALPAHNPMPTRWSRRIFAAAAFLFLFAWTAPSQNLPLYTKWVNYTPANGFPAGEVYCVTVDGNRVWAGTSEGLVLIEDGKVKKLFTMADGLVGRPVMGVAVDKQTGTLWIATFGGLSRLSGGQFTNYTNLSSGLANDLVYGVAVDGKDVWVATTAGLNRYNTYTDSWSIFNERNAPFEEPWTYGVVVNKDKVYLAVWGGGVIVYDKAKKYWRPYTDPDGEMELVLYRNQGLIHIIVSNIAYNVDTDMFWASTYFGLSGYDGRNWHNYLAQDSGLASDFINAVKSRGDGVWSCTDKGLSYLDYKTNTWVNYAPDPRTGGGSIRIIYPDGKKKNLSTATTLAHNYILNMDFQGDDVWVATAQGLSHGIRQPQSKELVYESARNRR